MFSFLESNNHSQAIASLMLDRLKYVFLSRINHSQAIASLMLGRLSKNSDSVLLLYISTLYIETWTLPFIDSNYYFPEAVTVSRVGSWYCFAFYWGNEIFCYNSHSCPGCGCFIVRDCGLRLCFLFIYPHSTAAKLNGVLLCQRHNMWPLKRKRRCKVW